MTAKSLLEQAEKESDEKLRQRIQKVMAKLFQLQRPFCYQLTAETSCMDKRASKKFGIKNGRTY